MTCGLVTAALIAASVSGSEPVTVGTEADYPPYTQIDEATGEIVGFDRDIGDEVCKRARLDCEWVAADFDKLIPGVVSGEFDVVISSLADTPARREIIDMTEPYWAADGIDEFIGFPGAPNPDAARVGVQSGTIHADHLAATGRTYETFVRTGDLLDALVTRHIDLAYGAWDYTVLSLLSEEHGIESLYEETIDSNGVVMAVCKGNVVLLGKLNDAIAAMWDDGTIDAISERWLY